MILMRAQIPVSPFHGTALCLASLSLISLSSSLFILSCQFPPYSIICFLCLSHSPVCLFFSPFPPQFFSQKITYNTHTHTHNSFIYLIFPYRDEDVGSVVCLCTRACLIKCSVKAVWTSAVISGEVWLIFIAGSIGFSAGSPFSLTSFFSSVSKTSVGALDMLCGRVLTLEVTGLLFQQGQHNFQKTKSETTNKARPQKLTTTANRLTEISGKNYNVKKY